jgi:hypothetical protein
MTKEEYFLTEWVHDDCDSRAIDENGKEFYFPSQPSLDDDGIWRQRTKEGVDYDCNAVDSLWYRGFQTRQYYLQLKNQTND